MCERQSFVPLRRRSDFDQRRSHIHEGDPAKKAAEDSGRVGIVAEVRLRPDVPLSPLGSGHAFNLGSAECIEAVHECYAELDLGGLAIRVA